MVVLIVERAPESVRGELRLWLLEPRAGVFVGRLSAEVRDRLWGNLVRRLTEREELTSSAVLVYSNDNEQGFEFRIYGDPTRDVVYFEGLQLVRIRAFEHG